MNTRVVSMLMLVSVLASYAVSNTLSKLRINETIQPHQKDDVVSDFQSHNLPLIRSDRQELN